MKIPKNILKKIEAIKEKQRKKLEARDEASREWSLKIIELEKIRRGRWAELVEYENYIVIWIKEFLQDGDVLDMLKTIQFSSLVIYVGNYWKGFPDNSITVCAVIELGLTGSNMGKVSYVEKHKGRAASTLPLGYVFDDFSFRPMRLANDLHPEFLKGFYGVLKTGYVWTIIDRQIRV